MRTIIYIHGLYSSSKESSKFDILKNAFDNVIAFDWSVDDKHIDVKLRELATNLVESANDIVIIGDSTGANFAIQLREMMQSISKFSYAKLILISPLFSVDMLRDKEIMPAVIRQQIKDVDKLYDALVFMPLNDEVVKYNKKSALQFVKIIARKDEHSFKTFSSHIDDIQAYIESLHV